MFTRLCSNVGNEIDEQKEKVHKYPGPSIKEGSTGKYAETPGGEKKHA